MALVLRILAKIALGAFVGGLIGAFFTGGDWIYTIVWSIAMPVVIVASVIGGVAGSGRGLAGVRGSTYAVARIESIQRTGLEFNGMQQCQLRLVVAPQGASAYTTTAHLAIATDDLRKFTAGTVLAVSRAATNAPDVAIVVAPPPEVAAMVEQARLDPSVIPVASAAPEWTVAPQPARVPRAGRGAAIVSLLIIVASVAVTLVPAYSSIARTATNVVNGDWDGNNMVTGSHQQFAVDEIAAVAGSYQFTDINFYPDYVLATGLTGAGRDTVDDYSWRWGRAMRDGPGFIQPTDLSAELFDASDLDFSMVAMVVEQALASSGLTDYEYVYPSVSRDFDGGAPVIFVSVSDAYYNASFTYSFEGEELSRSGTAFE